MDAREISRNLLTLCCKKYKIFLSLSEKKQQTIIRRLERNCMNKIIRECDDLFIRHNWANYRFVSMYNTEIYRHISNLLINDFYIEKLCTGKINPIFAPELSNYELTNLLEHKEIAAKILMQKIDEKYTTRYKCRKCGNKKIKYKETSGRSLGADEMGGFLYICSECGFYWT